MAGELWTWDETLYAGSGYLGPVPRAGRGTLPSGPRPGEDEILRTAGFAGPTWVVLEPGAVERTEDEVVASVFSLSGSTPHLFGERREEFERDLRALLRQVSPDGRFSELLREMDLDI